MQLDLVLSVDSVDEAQGCATRNESRDDSWGRGQCQGRPAKNNPQPITSRHYQQHLQRSHDRSMVSPRRLSKAIASYATSQLKSIDTLTIQTLANRIFSIVIPIGLDSTCYGRR